MDVLREYVLRTIRKFRMILPGERVAVACSGGADSTALLLLLHNLSEQLGCVLAVAHFNHRLRGEQSDADEEFVRGLAERLRWAFHVERADVRSAAQLARANQESKARELRYQFFQSLLDTGEGDRVAVGHTADDQAETVLHRLLRGAGTRGLTGIYPVVEGKIIRPLFEVRRAALREWLEASHEPWREDPSNQDLGYSRNRIRHQLLPLLTEFNPRVVETLAHTAEIAREEESFWQEYLQPILAAGTRIEGKKVRVDLDSLRQAPPAVSNRVLRWAVARAAELGRSASSQEVAKTARPPSSSPSSPADFGQIKQLLGWACQGQSGHALTLPQKITARKEFGHLILEKADKAPAESCRGYCYRVQVPSTVEVPEIGSSFAFELIPLAAGQARYNERQGALLDGKIVQFPLTLRNWQAGDAYRQKGHWKPRKLKELFQRNRVPNREREGWPVLLAGDQLVWARGLAVAEGYAPPPDSSEALLVRESRG